jgi:hypothetical protein
MTQIRYGLGSIAIALEIVAISVVAFSYDNPGGHLLAMGLTLALCAGHASRVAVRPWIALSAGTLVVMGFGLSATMHPDMMYKVVGYLCVIYLFSYYETVLKCHGVLVDRLLAKREIEHLATHDPLTGPAMRSGTPCSSRWPSACGERCARTISAGVSAATSSRSSAGTFSTRSNSTHWRTWQLTRLDPPIP